MRRCSLAIVSVSLAVLLCGCGPMGGSSSSGLPRPRPADDDEPPPVQAVAPQAGTSKTATSKNVTAQVGTPGAEAKAAVAEQDTSNISELDRRKLTINKLRVVAQALEEFKNRNESYPDQTVSKRLSWRVMLLPFLGQRELYLKFRLAEPWDSAHNRTLLKQIPDAFQSVVRRDEKTNFLLVTGPGTAYADQTGLSQERCPDGLANTILLIEVGDHLAKPWTQPEDYVFLRASAQQDFFSLRKDCAFVILGGGFGVRRLPADIADGHLLALLSPAGGEPESAKERTAYPYPELDLKLIAELERTPLKRFAANASAKPLGKGNEPQPPSSTATAASGTGTPAAKVEPAGSPDPRLPVPDEKALAAASAMARQLYKADYDAAKKRDEKRPFAKKLLDQANRMQPSADPAGLFVLLRDARDIGAQAGDIDTLLAAVEKLRNTFRVDPLPMKLKALEQAAPAIEGEAEAEKLFTKAMELEAELRANDDFDGAKRSLAVAQTAARRSKKRESVVEAAERREELEEAKRAFDRIAGALHKLVLSPDDPAANAAVGRYLCLVKQNWPRGLPLLARGDDAKLRELAAADVGNPTPAEAQAALADRWWDWSEGLGALERRGARLRAVHWYKLAAPTLPTSLTSERAKQRIAELEKDGHPKQAGTSAKTRSKSAR